MSLLAAGCSHTPKGVLSQEDMAQLMADTYMAEGVVDMNYRDFPNDSTRMQLKQSVYAKHGVSSADVDSAFVWYGNHIEDYIKVLDRTTEILRERQHDLVATASRQMSLSGDSVNIWAGADHLTVSPRTASRYVTFSIEADTTWRNGDIYELRFKPVNAQRTIAARMFVDYKEGLTRYFETPGSNPSVVTTLNATVDSTLTPERIYGYIDLKPAPGEHFQIDSISLVRMRKYVKGNTYFQSGRSVPWYGKKFRRPEEPSDTASASEPQNSGVEKAIAVEAPENSNVPLSTIPAATPRKSVRRR